MKITLLACVLSFTTLGLCDYPKYCNQGTPGNGDCEKEGYYTFCCIDEKRDEYVNKKSVKQWPYSFDPEGKTDRCGKNYEGGIWCAK